MNPNDYTTETGRRTAKRIRIVRDKAREAVKVADALESFAEEMCDRFELEAESLRKRIAELERETAEQADTIVDGLCRRATDDGHAVIGEEAESIPVVEFAEVLGCDADAYMVRNIVAENHLQASRRAQGLDKPQPDAESVDAWEELCTALGVKHRGIADVTQAVYGLQAALRSATARAIPVAELAEVLGCNAGAASVRQALKQVPPGGDRDHWNRVDDAICALAHIAGVDPMQKRDVVLEKVLAAVVPRKDTPQPDADGWYEHDGKSCPVCRGGDIIIYKDERGNVYEAPRGPQSLSWFGSRFWWRYADGRDVKRGEDS